MSTDDTPKRKSPDSAPMTTAAETASARLAEEFVCAANLYGSQVELVASPLIDGKSNWNPRPSTGFREPFGIFGSCGEYVRESSVFVIFVQAKTSEALDEFDRLTSSAGGWLARFGSTNEGPWMACASPQLDWIGWLFKSLWNSRYVDPRVDGTFRVSSPFTASIYLLRLGDTLKRETEANSETAPPAAPSSEAKPVDENQPVDLLHELTPQQGKIVTHLWNVKHATNWLSLPDDCWRTGTTRDQEDRAIESALERLRDKLNTLPRFGLTLEVHSAKQTTKLLRNPPRK